MDVRARYLEQFARAFASLEEIHALEPAHVALNGLEEAPNRSETLGGPPIAGAPFPTSIAYRYIDENDEEAPWTWDEAKRKTVVWLQGEDKTAYVFEGLMRGADLRSFFRNMVGIPEDYDPDTANFSLPDAAS